MPTAGKILLAEDNPDDQALIIRGLKKAKISNEIVVANDGVEAIEHLEGRGTHEGTQPDVPVLALLDIKMPRLGGLDVLKRMREADRTKRIPVVILTSSDEQQDIAASYALHANSFVRKPIDFAEFAEAVAKVGIYWLLLNLAPPPDR